MARNRFRLSADEIMSLPFSELRMMNVRQIKALTQSLIDVASKRIKALEDKGLSGYSYAYYTYKQRGKPFSVNGIETSTEAMNEFRAVKQFLKYKSSTVRNTRAAQKEAKKFQAKYEEQKKQGNVYEAFTDTGEVKSIGGFWDMFHRFQEEGLFIPGTYNKSKFKDVVLVEYLEAETEEQFRQRVADIDRELYEENIEEDDFDDNFF